MRLISTHDPIFGEVFLMADEVKPEPQPSPDPWGRVLTGVASFVAVVLSSLIASYLAPSEKTTPANIYVTDATGVVVDAPQIAALAGSQPGSYAITTWETGKKVESLSVVIGDGAGPGPQPKPEPKPEPKPDPKPQPKPSELWFICVEESKERDPKTTTQVLSNLELRAMFKDSRFRVVDKDVPEDCGQWVQQSVGSKLPRLFLVSPKGDVYFSGDLPKTAAETIAVVNKIKEGK